MPTGTPSQLTITPGADEGPRIDPPETCATHPGSAYIRVYGHGTRRFSVAPKDKPSGCVTPPAGDAPAEQCPEIDFNRFLWSLADVLRANGAGSGEFGLSDCFRSKPDMRYVVVVHDWKHADAAVTAVDAELRKWGIGDSLGVGVEGIPCRIGHGEESTARARR